jgi:arylsulfatase A-like enzyme
LNSTMILATKDHGSIAESRLCLPCTWQMWTHFQTYLQGEGDI